MDSKICTYTYIYEIMNWRGRKRNSRQSPQFYSKIPPNRPNRRCKRDSCRERPSNWALSPHLGRPPYASPPISAAGSSSLINQNPNLQLYQLYPHFDASSQFRKPNYHKIKIKNKNKIRGAHRIHWRRWGGCAIPAIFWDWNRRREGNWRRRRTACHSLLCCRILPPFFFSRIPGAGVACLPFRVGFWSRRRRQPTVDWF